MSSVRFVFFTGLLAFFPTPAPAQFDIAQLTAIWPHAARAGTTVQPVTVAGTALDEVDRLVFSHPGITASATVTDPLPFQDHPQPQYGRFEVTVADDVPAGDYEVWAVGRHGVSNSRVFRVTQTPCQAIEAPSHEIAAASALEPHSMVAARASTAALDWFRIRLDEKQTAWLTLDAQALDSRMIGRIELVDADGRVIQEQHGADGFDPMLVLEGLSAGEYSVRVSDFLYRGGGEYPYALTFSTDGPPDPRFSTVSPASGSLPPVRGTETIGTEPFTLDPSAVNKPDSPQVTQLPHAGQWWFAEGHGESMFEFTGKAGQPIAVDVISQRLGQPTDARLMVRSIERTDNGDATFKTVVIQDDGPAASDGVLSAGTRDPQAVATLPQDGTYQIVVADLDVGNTLIDRQAFRLQVGPPNPRFMLAAYRPFPNRDVNQARPIGSKLYRGGAQAIHVLALRHDGYSGPITLRAEGLPEGVRCEPGVISSNQTVSQLTLIADDAATSSVGSFRIIGTAVDESTDQPAQPATISVARGGGRDFTRTRRSHALMLAVSADDLAPLLVQFGGELPLTVKQGEKVSVPITLVRRDGGAAACTVRPHLFPGGISAGEVGIAADQSSGAMEVTVNAGVPPGRYTLATQTETKVKVRPNPQALQRAQQYRDHLQSLRDDPERADAVEAIDQAIAAADQAIEASKAAAAEKEITVFLPSTLAILEIVAP